MASRVRSSRVWTVAQLAFRCTLPAPDAIRQVKAALRGERSERLSAASARFRFDAPERLGSIDDGNAVVALEVQQVRIAGHDQIGTRGKRAREYMIILVGSLETCPVSRAGAVTVTTCA